LQNYVGIVADMVICAAANSKLNNE